MELGQNLPVRNVPARDRLPNRRAAITLTFERDGQGAAASPIGRALDLVAVRP